MRYTLLLIALCLVMPLTVLAQDAEAITIGDTVDGSLDSSQTEVLYVFEGELGRPITITLVSTDSGLDPYVRLLDEDGETLAQDDDSAGSLNARIRNFELPANGDYTIVATTLNGRGEGDFTLTVETEQVNKIEYTQAVDGQLTADNLFVNYHFTGSAGDTVIIQLTTENNANYDPYLYLRSADDPESYIIYDDDSAGNRNSRIGPFTLPETGEYIITATSLSQTDLGEYTLTLSRIEQQAVEIDGSAEGEITAGETAYFTFEGRSGQAVSITVDSGDEVDTRLVVRGPSNYEIASDDDSGGRIDPEISQVVLTEDGTYQIWVEPYSASEAGAFTVELQEVALSSLDDGPQQLRVTDKQPTYFVTFEGNADETVRLNVVVDSGEVISPTITITQAGEQISYVSTSGINEIALTFIVPDDGTANVQIDYIYITTTLTISIERIAEDK